MRPLKLSEWINGELEKISIVVPMDGKFKGKPVLVIHDDGIHGTQAPMLFDTGTQNWLLKRIAELQTGIPSEKDEQ